MALTSQNLPLEIASEHAWRDWGERSTFPNISFSGYNGLLSRLLHASEGRRSSRRVYWVVEEDWWFGVRLGVDTSLDEIIDWLPQGTGVDPAAWAELVRVFVERLGAKNVRRAA